MKLVILSILFSTLTAVFYARDAAAVSAKQEESVKVLQLFRGNRNNAFRNNFYLEGSNSLKSRRKLHCPPGCCPLMPEEPCIDSIKWSWTGLSKMKRQSCPQFCCNC